MEIFKAYDIRGIYGTELIDSDAYNLGRAFVLFIGKRPKIVIGRDGRLSSPKLFSLLKKGINDQGGDVVDIGISTTPMMYFADCFLKTSGGIIVTASHNPKEYNGFKLVLKDAFPVSEQTGLKEIKKIVDNIASYPLAKKKGSSTSKSILTDYAKCTLSDFDVKNFNFKIGIDTANGAAGIAIDPILKNTGLKVFHINKKVDGSFPSHEADPLKIKNLKPLSELIKKKKLDLGISFDGDGDRVMFMDEKGRLIPSDIIIAIIGDVLGEKVLCDFRCSRIIKDCLKDKTTVSRVGHSFIKEIMKKNDITFGGEYSGHFYLNEKCCFEAPFFALFKILEQMNFSQKKFSEVADPYMKYFHSGEINFKIKDDPKKIIAKIESKYKKGKILKQDGLRVDFENWWFLVRTSNTEPVLRLIVEAETKKLLDEKKGEIEKIILKKGD